jgi:hypothetical protein
MGDTFRHIQQRYPTRALCVAVVLGACLMAAGFKPAAKGLILGTLFSALNFRLMGFFLLRCRGLGGRLAGISVRMALMAVPLVMATTLPVFDLWGVVPGLFSVPAMILLDAGLGLRASSTHRRIQEG